MAIKPDVVIHPSINTQQALQTNLKALNKSCLSASIVPARIANHLWNICALVVHLTSISRNRITWHTLKNVWAI